MRRLLGLLTALAVAALVLATGLLAPARSASDYRVDALFDTAKGIVPGQIVKIAGAHVGKIVKVKLTPDFNARIELTVDRRFAPFRTNAKCEIRPEGLIAENFINCDPGSPTGDELKGRAGKPPTVPVTRTSVPINLTDLFNVFSAPTRNRFPLIVTTLGLGLAGRGEDLNAVIRRANPALARARRVLAILGSQRAQLARSVSSTDRILAQLAGRRERVRDFLDAAARVTERTAQHRGALAEDVRRLPALLDAARPALERLDELAASGTPVANDLRVAAPDVNRLVIGLEPFARRALPVLRQVGTISREGERTAKSSLPAVKDVRTLARAGIPTADLLNKLFSSLRDRGFTEGLANLLYYGSAGLSRFDATSHILPAHLELNVCGMFATTPQPGCDSRYSGATPTAAAKARGAPRQGRAQAPRRQAAPPALAPAPGTPRPGAPRRRNPVAEQLKKLNHSLDDILGRVGLPRRPAPSTGRKPDPGGDLLRLLLR